LSHKLLLLASYAQDAISTFGAPPSAAKSRRFASFSSFQTIEKS